MKRNILLFSVVFFVIGSTITKISAGTCLKHALHFSAKLPADAFFLPGTVDENTSAAAAQPLLTVPPCGIVSQFDFKLDDACNVNFQELSIGDTGTILTSVHWKFGDGAEYLDHNPKHKYTVAGTYIAYLITHGRTANNTMCSDTICKPVVVPCQETAACTLNPAFSFKTDSCSAAFKDLSAAGSNVQITSWKWDFGDGTSSGLQHPAHVYLHAGTYNVCLAITGRNAAGEICKDNYCAPVTVNCGPNVCNVTTGLSYKNYLCTVWFSDFVTTNKGTTIQSRSWDFGDGTFSNAENPIHTYANPGTYTILFKVVGQNGMHTCQSETKIVIVIKSCVVPPCDVFPKFNHKVDSCTATFVDASTSGPNVTLVGREWKFGDGTTSTLQNPVHVYTTAGTYIVTMILSGENTDGHLCQQQIQDTIIVKHCVLPVCGLVPAFISNVDACHVYFNDSSGVSDNTSITSWLWEFGDGDTSTVQHPVHEYKQFGTYSVCLTIVGKSPTGEVCTKKLCKVVNVPSCNPGPCPLFAKFTSSSDSCKVSFTDISVKGAGMNITGWSWSFGDGTVSTLQHPVHVYANDDTYMVILKITGTNAAGAVCTDERYTKITVKGCGNVPVCNLTAKFDYTSDSCKINFKDRSVGDATTTIVSWHWNFGDNEQSDLQNPQHAYEFDGTYTVCLTVTGKRDSTIVCGDVFCFPVTVKGCKSALTCQLFPKFNYKADSCHVSFTDLSTAGPGTDIKTYQWYFGTGNGMSSLQNPVYTYKKSGRYLVVLVVRGLNTDGTDCFQKVEKMIEVKDCVDPTIPCSIQPKFYFTVDSCNVHFVDSSSVGPATKVVSTYWQFGDGDASGLKDPTHTYSKPGMYAVCLMVSGINQDGSRCQEEFCEAVFVNDCNPTGISDLLKDKHFSVFNVYPNPARDQITINFELERTEQVNISIVDLQGKIQTVIQDGYLTAGTHNVLWKNNLPSGLYLIMIKTQNTIERKKMVIEK